MSDRNIEQINHNLDQVLAISAENTRNIANLQTSVDHLQTTVATIAGTVEQLSTSANRRLQQHDRELDDQDERTERLEHDRINHADRMDKLEALLVEIKEERKDVLTILQMMTQRFVSE